MEARREESVAAAKVNGQWEHRQQQRQQHRQRDENQEHSNHPDGRISASRLALRNFTSQWFLVPQGTGALALVLHQNAYQFRGLAIISQTVWVLAILMLASMLLLYLLRALLYPSHVAKALRTSMMETACLASISIAYTTIVQSTALNLVHAWGKAWGTVCFVLWWINLAMAVSTIGIIYIFTSLESRSIDLVPVAIRLPPIALLTVAAGGGVVCHSAQLSSHLQIPIVIVSYLCVGAGLLLALMCDAAFLIRVFDASWPSRSKIFSIMIACGPYGQASFALQMLGAVVQKGAFSSAPAALSSEFIAADMATEHIISICSTLLALLLWGYGTFWWIFACISIVHEFLSSSQRKALLKWDQNLAAWSLVFPWGVYSNAAIEFGANVLPSRAFDVWSTVLVILLVVLWLLNMAASMTGVVNGKVLGLDRGWRALYVDEVDDKES